MIWFKVLILLILFWMINFLISTMIWIQNSRLPFECGFENQSWSFTTSSLHYVKVVLIFILFDLELLYLLSVFFTQNFWAPFLLLLILWFTWNLELNLTTLNWLI